MYYTFYCFAKACSESGQNEDLINVHLSCCLTSHTYGVVPSDPVYTAYGRKLILGPSCFLIPYLFAKQAVRQRQSSTQSSPGMPDKSGKNKNVKGYW